MGNCEAFFVARRGLWFICRKEVQVGEIVFIYLENVNTKDYREIVYTKFSESQYKLEAVLPLSKEYIVTPGEKKIIQLDVTGGGFPDNKLIYLGAHMITTIG